MGTFPPFNRLKACRYGQMLFNTNDTYVGRSLDLYGEYSQGEIELFSRLLNPGNVVIEVGANIGSHTLFLAQHVTRSGVVIAFEPQRVVFQTLCANLALNSIPNAYCFQQAVGAKPGAVVIPSLDYTQPNNFGGLSLGSFQAGEQVPLATLDAFNFAFCHFLKIDVEGMEQQVLEGAVNLIRKFKPVIYLENDRAEKSDELVRYLDSLSYRMYWHKPPYFNPSNFFGNPENVFPKLVSDNMLCVHSTVPHDLQGFEPVQIPGKS